MNTLRCPANIEVLLHCHTTPGPHPRLDAPVVKEALADFLANGVIEPWEDEPDSYRTTALGQAWVAALCRVPMPQRVYVDVDGTVLNRG